MALKCMFGLHSWHNSRCLACGKVRDGSNDKDRDINSQNTLSRDPLTDAINSFSKTAKELGGNAGACLKYTCKYLATRSIDNAETARLKYIRISGSNRKKVQNELVMAAEQLAPISELSDYKKVLLRAELLSIGNIYGRYNRRKLVTALQYRDVPNALYTREDILLSTLHDWHELGDDSWHMIKILLDDGANPNCHEDNEGWTPLHYAVYYKSEDLADLLFQFKADQNISDKEGRKPLELMNSRNDAMTSLFTKWQRRKSET